MLRFSLAAWLKLQLLCHAGDTEIGAFAITSPDDPLYVLDLVTIKQSCSCVSVEFDDDAVADFFDEQVDLGRAPDQFFRIWAHTHPGDSPQPSGTDEETFQRVFGTCDWAVMFILARNGATYCRLRVNSPRNSGHEKRCIVSLSTTIACEVDYTHIAGGDLELPLEKWKEEYTRNVSKEASWWEDQDRLMVDEGLLFHDERVQADLVDQLLELDEEAMQSLMESLQEQDAQHGQLVEVTDAQ